MPPTAGAPGRMGDIEDLAHHLDVENETGESHQGDELREVTIVILPSDPNRCAVGEARPAEQGGHLWPVPQRPQN